MGIYSTLRVSRSAAIKKLEELQSKPPTNEQLEDNLAAYLMTKNLYNFRVVDDDLCDEECKCDNTTLETLNQ